MSFARNFLGLGLATAATALVLSHPLRAQTIPSDAQGGCPVGAPTLAGMFEGGAVTLDGVVKPADSTLPIGSFCGFFDWSEQMFLWLTSPAPKRYGGGGRILFSPTFYTVTPADQKTGRRTFIRNDPRLPIRMFLRTTELGPHMRPALLARSGQVIEVQRQDPRRPLAPMVRLQTGATAQVTEVRRDEKGALQFLGAGGRALQVKRLALPTVKRQMVQMQDGRRVAMLPVATVRDAIQARKFVFKGVPVFFDLNGNVIDVEPGQADFGVLLSQNGSLIYYITAVNDVYAYFRTMQGAPVTPDPTVLKFPMTMADANAIKAFAATKGHTIVDPEALAIETKSSWIEASAVPDPENYVQVTATVPTFDKSNPDLWVPNGQANLKLVMVGLHVVGSTNGHGEMLWGTFEHFGNAPNAEYQYNSTVGPNPKTVAQNTVGTWLFTPSGAGTPFNTTHAQWDEAAGTIVGVPGGSPVLPTPVLRTSPWGMPGSNAGSNTQLISLNSSVINQLLGGDVRKTYFQLGTTWTKNGLPPETAGAQTGTTQLANATIETFVQADPFASPPVPSATCFSCHGTNTVNVSHIFGVLKPLP
jgi:hypothetical protein